MRQLRNLRHEMEERREDNRIQAATEAATKFLIQNLPEDQRAIIAEYVNKYGADWWRKLDLDTGGMLGDEFRKFGYTDTFLGQHELQPLFKDILARAVTT